MQSFLNRAIVMLTAFLCGVGIGSIGMPASAQLMPSPELGTKTAPPVVEQVADSRTPPMFASLPAQEMNSLVPEGSLFIPNEGQWSDSSVFYGLHSRAWSVAFRESAIDLILRQPAEAATSEDERSEPSAIPWDRESPREAIAFDQTTVTLTFPGSNAVNPIGTGPTQTTVNYFVGGDERKPAANLPTFSGILYEDLYPGVDLLVIENAENGSLKYEFNVAPEADARLIQMQYVGLDEPLSIGADGALHIETPLGTLIDLPPIACQPIACSGETTNVPVRYKLDDGGDVCGFALSDCDCDRSRPLTIDPELEWMTYLGGTATDFGRGVAVDDAGNAYIAGWTLSTDFDGHTNPYFGGTSWGDAWLTKVNPTGQVEWMSYYGGAGSDGALAVSLDDAGNIFLTGITDSLDFIGKTNSRQGHYDAFALKADPSGQVEWMTYFGGSSFDKGRGIAVDNTGNVFVAGRTSSLYFTGAVNSLHGQYYNTDAFIIKLDPSGQVVSMRYVGGPENDEGYALAIDHAGNVLIAGVTSSAKFEGRINVFHGGLHDAFALKVAPSGRLEWVTFLGGGQDDEGHGVDVDEVGNAFVAGYTKSPDFEGRNNSMFSTAGGKDAFAVKVDPTGQVEWMRYVGGRSDDTAFAIAADEHGNSFVTGQTWSKGFEGKRKLIPRCHRRSL
jgi:hypothetical protein